MQMGEKPWCCEQAWTVGFGSARLTFLCQVLGSRSSQSALSLWGLALTSETPHAPQDTSHILAALNPSTFQLVFPMLSRGEGTVIQYCQYQRRTFYSNFFILMRSRLWTQAILAACPFSAQLNSRVPRLRAPLGSCTAMQFWNGSEPGRAPAAASM